MGYKISDGEQVLLELKTAKVHWNLAHFFLASPAFVCKTNPTKKNAKNNYFYQNHRNTMKSPHSKCANIRHNSQMSASVHTFFTPRIFFALFFLSFICLRDFSTLVARPFCRNPNTLLSNISRPIQTVLFQSQNLHCNVTWICMILSMRREHTNGPANR